MTNLVYYTVLTTKGLELLAAAAANKTQLVFSHLACGDGGGNTVKPVASVTKLVNEKHRAPLTAVYINKDDSAQVFCELVVPPDVGGFYIRELGLYEQGGDLVAYGSCPATYKSNINEGATKALVINMIIAVDNTATVALKIEAISQVAINRSLSSAILEHEASVNHPPASESVQGMVKLSSDLSNMNADTAASMAALNHLKNQTMPYSDTAIGDLDLNNLVTPGFFYQNKKDSATLTNNYPTEGIQGAIAVFNQGVNLSEDGSYAPRITQVFIDDRSHHFFVRHFRSWQQVWTHWEMLLNPQNLNYFMPAGIPLPWPSLTLPEGAWLVCDGSKFDKTRFLWLAKAYPSGTLPDLRSEFIRGADYGRGVNPNGTPLARQGGQLERHRHTHGGIPSGGGQQYKWGTDTSASGSDRGFRLGGGTDWHKFAFTSWGNPENNQRVGDETRPRNVAFLYIVRAC